jgi:hypothetical protein
MARGDSEGALQMSRSIWKSCLCFALVGPAVGATMVLCLIAANFAFHDFIDMPPTEQSLTLLAYAAILFIGGYIVGGPAALATGTVAEIMSRRAFGERWIVAANILVGAAISMATIYGLDEYVLPHPHGDAAPGLGPHIWLLTAAVGALSAAICTFVFMRRRA